MTRLALPRTFALVAGTIAFLVIARTGAAFEPTGPPTTKAVRHCPVMPEEEIDESIFVDWRGTRVYFCCERCKAKFRRDPEKYASAVVLAGDASSRNSALDDRARHEVGDKNLTTQIHETPEAEKHPAFEAGTPPEPLRRQGQGRGQGPKLLDWLGKFHPVTLHLPIGVLIAAVIAEFLFAWRRTPLFNHAGRFCVWVAALAGLITGILGWLFGGLRWVDTDWLLAFHRWLGTATAIGFLILLWTSERMHSSRASRLTYRLVLLGVFCFVAATGFFGGAMVWGLDHYAW